MSDKQALLDAVIEWEKQQAELTDKVNRAVEQVDRTRQAATGSPPPQS